MHLKIKVNNKIYLFLNHWAPADADVLSAHGTPQQKYMFDTYFGSMNEKKMPMKPCKRLHHDAHSREVPERRIGYPHTRRNTRPGFKSL